MASRVALVTGSSTVGIGKGIVEQFAKTKGLITVLHGIESEETLESIAKDLNEELGFTSTDRRIFGAAGDVTSSSDTKRLITGIQRRFGSLDILVNNVGVQYVAPVEDFPEEEWDRVVNTILKGTFLPTKYALPGMKEKGFGRIINTGSMHSLVASPYKSAYNAAKHGVAGFTKTVALECATVGNVTVNCVCPGYVLTDMIRKQIKNQALARGIPEDRVIDDVLLADQPIKKFIKPEQVGALCAFLTTDEASAVTGSILSVDGGWTAR